MKIGIDISQLAYKGTGVSRYLASLLEQMLTLDKENEYVLFGSSLRGYEKLKNSIKHFEYLPRPASPAGGRLAGSNNRTTVKLFRLPPVLLDVLWNRLHIIPIEWLIGDIDVFISSDWLEPPSKAKKVTILYDVIVYKHPEETDKKIIDTQKRKLSWAKKEANKIICISEATKRDAVELLGIEEGKLAVVYPGS